MIPMSREYLVGRQAIEVPRCKRLEMLKTAFVVVLGAWLAGCLLMIIYSREIAEFLSSRI